MRPAYRSYRRPVASAGCRACANEAGAAALNVLSLWDGFDGCQGGCHGRPAAIDGPWLGGRSVVKQLGRPRQVEPLAVVHPEGPQQVEILVARDSLGRNRGADAVGESDE